MNKTVLVVLIAVVIIGGIMIYTFNIGNEEGENLHMGLQENQNIDEQNKEKMNEEENENDEEIENNEKDEQQVPELPIVDIGQVAPNFTLKNLDGEEVSLEDYRGKTVILNFWASWCPPCRKEMPDFQKFYEEYMDKDFTILAINLNEPLLTVANFIKENEYTFPVLLDSTGEIGYIYMVNGIPTSYILDKEGVIRSIRFGPMSYPEMKQIIEGLKED